ncbi:SpoIID/LytB domain-containing protein [Oscillospiraceae bacterium OttesenSCG-928-G22]|nr:SpoIID/LytB domain-containing protein [Oscillospiraceae bacterium OttesenSCG-928-G22]
MKKFLYFLLLAALFAGLVPLSRAAAASDPTVKVGLYYGSNGLPSANLANEVGAGYQFGYFDANRNFIALGETAQEKITVLKDKNMYVANGVWYDSLPPSGSKTIGAYHADAGQSYASFDAARTACSQVYSSTGQHAFPAYINGQYRVRFGSYTSLQAANSAAASSGYGGASGVGGSATCFTVVITSTGEILYEYDSGNPLGICPVGNSNPVTWFKGYKYAGMFEYRRNAGNDLTVINVVPLCEYTKGVLPYEMNPAWPAEALKAQAVCAANFAVHNRNKHSSMGFDICNDIDCQVYRGRNTATANSDSAAEAVRGLGLYYDGKVCNTVYHSSNGGHTESAKNVWGSEVAYLQPVPDKFEDLQAAYNGIWSFDYTADNITWILNNKGYSIGKISRAYVETFTPAGNVLKVTFVDTSGKSLSFERERARTILNSPTLGKYTHSQRYTINGASGGAGGSYYVNDANNSVADVSGLYAIGGGGESSVLTGNSTDLYVLSGGGNLQTLPKSSGGTNSSAGSAPSGVFRIAGTGWGHNVGMSQYGAKGMAEQGYGFEDILRYYYTGVRVTPFE